MSIFCRLIFISNIKLFFFISSLQDEVLAISDKVIIKAEDLISWIDNDLEWDWGLRSIYNSERNKNINSKTQNLFKKPLLDFTDIENEQDCGKFIIFNNLRNFHQSYHRKHSMYQFLFYMNV